MDSFAVHLVHQPIPHKVCKNLNIVHTVCCGAVCQIHMIQIGIIRTLFKDFHTVFINEFLCDDEIGCILSGAGTILGYACIQQFLCYRITGFVQMTNNLILKGWLCWFCRSIRFYRQRTGFFLFPKQ